MFHLVTEASELTAKATGQPCYRVTENVVGAARHLKPKFVVTGVTCVPPGHASFVSLVLDPLTPYNRLLIHRSTTDQLGHFTLTDIAPGKVDCETHGVPRGGKNRRSTAEVKRNDLISTRRLLR
jgi:hypothetical protein